MIESMDGHAPDTELAAVTRLGQMRSRLRTIVLAPAVVTGALLGIPGYLLVRELQLDLWGVNWVWLSAAGFMAPLLGLSSLGAVVARVLIRQRTASWLDRLAAEYRVPRATLEQLARSTEDLQARF